MKSSTMFNDYIFNIIAGCEMEALTGASIAALTIYDMCKPVYKGVEIINSKLLVKTGGKSGDYMNIKDNERVI